MKKFFILLTPLLVGSCATAQLPDFIYIPHLKDGICREYKIVDKANFKMSWVRDMQMIEKGHCDQMVGFNRLEFKKAQNAYRDAVKECSK